MALVSGCSKSSIVAPADATITVSAAPSTISSNGSTTVTALVLGKGGAPVQDGTQVSFLATVGTLQPPQSHTRNGQASTILSAPRATGTTAVTATSGGITSQAVTVTLAGTLGVSVAAQPQSGPVNTVIAFTATVAPATGPAIDRFDWDFGDSKTASTSTGTTSHAYGSAGPMVVKVTATAQDGSKPVAQIEVVITST